MSGPFENEQQARELPAVKAIYEAFTADPGPGTMAPHTLRMLLDALASSLVKVGAYDIRVAEWLAGFEPQTAAVAAAWVERAAEASGRIPSSGHGHLRPAISDQRATLAVATAILRLEDPASVHDRAVPPGTCPACVTVAGLQLGFALCAALAGRPFVDADLQAELLALIKHGRDELEGGAS